MAYPDCCCWQSHGKKIFASAKSRIPHLLETIMEYCIIEITATKERTVSYSFQCSWRYEV